MTFSKHIQTAEKAEKSWVHKKAEYLMILKVSMVCFFRDSVFIIQEHGRILT